MAGSASGGTHHALVAAARSIRSVAWGSRGRVSCGAGSPATIVGSGVLARFEPVFGLPAELPAAPARPLQADSIIIMIRVKTRRFLMLKTIAACCNLSQVASITLFRV